jgi:hypothetical protein
MILGYYDHYYTKDKFGTDRTICGAECISGVDDDWTNFPMRCTLPSDSRIICVRCNELKPWFVLNEANL